PQPSAADPGPRRQHSRSDRGGAVKKYVVGIDLGTTHSALAYTELGTDAPRSTVMPIPQLVAKTEASAVDLRPSFLYFAHESDGLQALPWDASRRYAVGEYARQRGSDAPARVVSSAKSWLCHPGVDRRGSILPPAAPDDIAKISPVE